ncbi:hypothetical protein C8Q70DRAFT_50248 [Cubamyces menziesii]|nr:hypothetical protein C8Q70DRAFT_50248 [Cubamyces menziesii]
MRDSVREARRRCLLWLRCFVLCFFLVLARARLLTSCHVHVLTLCPSSVLRGGISSRSNTLQPPSIRAYCSVTPCKRSVAGRTSPSVVDGNAADAVPLPLDLNLLPLRRATGRHSGDVVGLHTRYLNGACAAAALAPASASHRALARTNIAPERSDARPMPSAPQHTPAAAAVWHQCDCADRTMTATWRLYADRCRAAAEYGV